MTIRIRAYQPADYRLILSLVPRFSEFELPAWRLAEGIDRKNRVSIEQAMG